MRSHWFDFDGRLRERVAGNELVAFLLVTFGWTWGWDALYYTFGWWESLPTTLPRQWGVPIGALVVIWASDTAVRDWLGTVLDWRRPPVVYLMALAVPLGITNVQPVVRAVGGGSLTYAPPGPLWLVVPFLLANAVVLGGIEELGWRGFLQPRLQSRTSVLTAGLCVGVVWWAWHLPLFLGHANFVLEPVPFVRYTAFVIGASVVFGAFVNVTEGSVVPLMVMHATTNLGAFLAGSGGVLAPSRLLPLVVGSGLWWLLVVALVARFGPAMHPGDRGVSASS